MRRVLEIVLNAEGTVGGEQRHVIHVIEGLDRSRYEVEVVTWDIPAFVAELEAHGVHTVPVTAKRILDLGLLRRIESVIREGRYDLVHAHGHRAGLLGRLAAVRAGVGHIVWTCHLAENKADKNPLVRSGYRRALAYLDARTDVTIAVSPLLRDWLLSEGVEPSRIEVIPNGVDCDVFKPMPRDAVLLESLGLKSDAPIVGTVARLTEQKGVETLVDAAAQVQQAIPGTQFLIVGAGPLEEQLVARAAEAGTQITFAGERGDIPEVLALLDVAVVPSLWEGAFCFALLEAMASGTPTVCSDIEMFTDVVTSGREAMVFGAGDPDSLASAILSLLRDTGLGERVSQAARTLVSERFSAQHARAETIAVYERLLKGDPS